MGKYAKKTKVGKTKSTNSSGTVKQDAKRKKVKARKTAAKNKGIRQRHADRKAIAKELREISEAGAGMDASMSATDVAPAARSAGEKLVSFLERAKTESKVKIEMDKMLRKRPAKEELGVVLTYCAGRGLTTCVRALIDSGAPINIQDPSQPVGKSTPLQLAASRGHVNVVRLLVEAGADKVGAAEAAQELAKLGAVFMEERKAILSVLGC
eukprot:TRINITY_DN7512_c2_g5_i1.p1 TRINITY_DN7512_c2_g5~~TRINITY_DN7512_c2_g5_i1.p1  ORF type:complete len:211 (-),score=49.67 TRINITY_DN7512_c2_g5_i1:53-685(-)